MPEEDSCFISVPCISSSAARNVEKELIAYGCDGGTGGGDDDATYVYAYLKTSVTDP